MPSRAAAMLMLAALAPLAATARAAPEAPAELTVRADQPGPTIDRNLFGQFSEQLGYGIE